MKKTSVIPTLLVLSILLNIFSIVSLYRKSDEYRRDINSHADQENSLRKSLDDSNTRNSRLQIQVSSLQRGDKPLYQLPRLTIEKKPKKRIVTYGGERIGAICCDGTRSYATGRGACSWHGGVCQWLYK
jgi:hypothetical protein